MHIGNDSTVTTTSRLVHVTRGEPVAPTGSHCSLAA